MVICMSALLKYINYNLATIRELVNNSLTNNQLKNLCFDYFKEVYEENQHRDELIREMVDYANRQYKIDQLLKEIKRINPAQYSVHENGLVEAKARLLNLIVFS